MSNLRNGTIFKADNIYILKAIDGGSVDLMHLDLPFNTDKNWLVPIGTDKGVDMVGFKGTWKERDIGRGDLEIFFNKKEDSCVFDGRLQIPQTKQILLNINCDIKCKFV